jgi:hypothetical protein
MASGFRGLTWIAILLTFLGAAGWGGGVSERRNRQQGQGFAIYRAEEVRSDGPPPNWTHRLTGLVIRDLYINKEFSIL